MKKKYSRQTYFQEHKEQEYKTHKIYLKENPWLPHLYDARKRCTNNKNSHYKYYGGRGITCSLSVKEIKFLWFRDKAYLLEQPSIDRINNDGNYTVDNCRFIEMKENTALSHKKKILQKSIFGVHCRIWDSITSISKELKCDYSNIAEAIRKHREAYGFKWEIIE